MNQLQKSFIFLWIFMSQVNYFEMLLEFHLPFEKQILCWLEHLLKTV